MTKYELDIEDFVRRTVTMTACELGTYMLIRFAYWAHGGPLPCDDETLRTIGRCDAAVWFRTRAKIATHFTEKDGMWIDAQADKEIARAKDISAKRADASAMGVAARELVKVDPKPRFTPPTVEECKAHAKEIGMPEIEGEHFWLHHDSRDWMQGKVRMARWRSAMGTWKMNWSKGIYAAQKAAAPESPHAIDLRLKAIDDEMKSIRYKSGYEDATGWHWNQGMPAEYKKLQEQRSILKRQLTGVK